MKSGYCAAFFRVIVGGAAVLVSGNVTSAEAACVGTNINADIAADVTWTTAGSPYCITAAGFNVLEPATLTIQAGVTVKVTGTIIVTGALVVNGSSGNRVTFDEINSGSKWGFLQFRRGGCGESLKMSVIGYADFNNMQSYLYLSQQSLFLDNVTINLNTTNWYGFAAYNNNAAACPGNTPQLSLSNSTVNFTSSANHDNTSFLHVDGVNSSVTNTSITANISGGVITNAYAVQYDRSNTSAYTTATSGNTLTVSVTNDAAQETYGIYYKTTYASGSFIGNTVTVTGPRTVYGVRTIADTVVRNNTITVNATPNATCAGCDGSGAYAIYSTGNASACSDLIVNNKISIATADYRSLFGIWFQAGNVTGNRITATHTGSSGAVYGVMQQYYDSCFKGNSLSLSGAGGITLYGYYAGTNYNAANNLVVKNNIFSAAGAATKTGINKDSFNSATIVNSYNLFHGFTTNYNGVTAAIGEIYGDPLFSDAELHLAAASPAIDAGDPADPYSNEPAPNGGRVNMGAWGNTASASTSETTPPASPSILIDGGNAGTTSTSVTLAISATDNVGVTGYYVSESSTTPVASAFTAVTSAARYSASVAFTLSAGDGTKTVYAWFRDAAGNISAATSDTIILDSSLPASPSISIDGGNAGTTFTSVTLAISATDNVGVTGYYVSESSTTPVASAFTAVTSAVSYSASVGFTLSAGYGTKTVYIWFRDAAGNISAASSDTIVYSALTPIPTLSECGLIFLISLLGLHAFRRGVLWPTAR